MILKMGDGVGSSEMRLIFSLVERSGEDTSVARPISPPTRGYRRDHCRRHGVRKRKAHRASVTITVPVRGPVNLAAATTWGRYAKNTWKSVA